MCAFERSEKGMEFFMININILFPSERKRTKAEIASKIESKYGKKVTKFKFNHIGDEHVYLYVYLEDETPLYITANLRRLEESITICEDMSL
ncbi:MAG: hypothetical protein V8R39_00625 [Clostridia bacterium]